MGLDMRDDTWLLLSHEGMGETQGQMLSLPWYDPGQGRFWNGVPEQGWCAHLLWSRRDSNRDRGDLLAWRFEDLFTHLSTLRFHPGCVYRLAICNMERVSPARCRYEKHIATEQGMAWIQDDHGPRYVAVLHEWQGATRAGKGHGVFFGWQYAILTPCNLSSADAGRLLASLQLADWPETPRPPRDAVLLPCFRCCVDNGWIVVISVSDFLGTAFPLFLTRSPIAEEIRSAVQELGGQCETVASLPAFQEQPNW